jgi:hypothetical protein
MRKGAVTRPAKALYSCSFFANGDGHYESSRRIFNDLAELPKEGLDEASERLECMWSLIGDRIVAFEMGSSPLWDLAMRDIKVRYR